ncbi:MAG: divergent polysaccharide deacetylase family protein [Candidatus Aminicenantes bacterium]|nr:divergent polysaccharide deacetylase family protein [Candidatus Aminicenantes bacterium]
MPKNNHVPGKSHLLTLRTLYSILILLAVSALLGLDYLGWKQGEKAFIFDLILKKESSVPIKNLENIVDERLVYLGISPDFIQKYRDQADVLHLKVDLSSDQYESLSPRLEQYFQNIQVSVIKTEELHDPNKDYFLWELVQAPQQRLFLLFSCTKIKKEAPKTIPYRRQAGKVALIIDDMGYSLEAVSEIFALKQPLTIAILPYSPLGYETASLAHQKGLEVILHLPLESLSNDGHYNDIEGIIRADMKQEEIIETISRNLKQVPFIKGINNHMGSKITADEDLMRIILEQIQGTNLYFIDSMTTGGSTAYQTARSLRIPSAYRHVFLDAERDETSIRRQLIELFQMGQKKGMAVGICHPVSETLNVLKRNLHLAGKYNIRLVFASQIVK